MNCDHIDSLVYVTTYAYGSMLFNAFVCIRCGTDIMIEYDPDADGSEFNCLDCGVDTREVDEYYMTHDPLWLQANPQDDGMLCIGCLESRIGRKLNRNDFTNVPINLPDETTSERFLNRLATRNEFPKFVRKTLDKS